MNSIKMSRVRIAVSTLFLWVFVSTVEAQYKPQLQLIVEPDTCDKPQLKISGKKEVCLTRNETYSTNAVDPDTMMTWTVTDLATGQAVCTSSAPEAHYGTESELPAGRYLITAQNPAYCNVAEFVLTVKDPPPAPTVDDMDPDNPTIACRNSAILLKATTDNPYGTFVWVPGCASATPDTVMGDEVSVIYGNEVCDIDVYAYDRQLGCRSSGPYVHHVGAFVLSPTTLPQTLRVCPGTEVDWTGCVPYQEGVIYDWEIEENKQYCATLKSTPDNNSVWLQINELDPPVVYPVPFTITLTRTYCSGLKDIQRVQITIADLHTDLTINVNGDNPLCQGGSVRLSCPNCTGSSTWNVGGTLYANSVPDPYTLNRTGDVRVTLECNPYDYCTNSAYLSKGETTIHVNPLPTVLALGCDGTEVYTIPPLNTGDYSFRWSHTGTDNWKVRVASGQSQYSCTVTDRTTGCSTTLTTECGGCDRMTIVDDGYDYCTREARFHVVGATGRVDWTIVGSPCGAPTYSGTNKSRIFIPINEVGTYALFAHVDGNPCYSADTYFTVDFIPEFTIERKCTDIVIRNYSQYLDGSRTVTFLVDGTSCTFPVSDRSYIVRPSTTGTHTVTLSMYDGRPLTGCISETLTTVNSEGRVTITSDNVDPAKACDNTAVLLRSSVSSGADITASDWHFGDHSHYLTAGGNVYHTFERGSSYTVTATVTDENGCVSIGNVSIRSSSNNLEQPSLYTSNQTVCPGADKLIEYYVNGGPVPAGANNYYTWRYPVVNNQSSTHYVQSTGDYSVFVTNDNSCIAEAATNVPFKNKPTAIIIPSKYYYCLGETVELYGEPSFGDTYTYNWTVTNTATNAVSVYTGQSVSFTVDDAVRTTYAIDLTVTNSENCPDDAEQVEIVAVGQLEAPHIDFSDEHYCIGKEPVKLVCDGPVTGVHWSNGDYGPGATYYYPTTANAYYYDEESGCRSDMARIYIPAAPDFDGLLTGCYKVCPAKMEAMLPVYGLFPYWQRFDYKWYMDNSLLDNNAGATLPRWLPLGGYGQYVLDVTYFQDCVEQSKPLVLEEDTKCKCDSVSIEIKQEYKCTEKCELEYTFDVTVCNNSSNTICFDKLVPLFDITSGNITITTNTFIPTVLPPGGCVNFIIGLTALTLDPMSVAFQLEDNDCAGCTKDFGLDLTPKVDCNMEVSDGDIDPNGMMSGSGVYYYDFSIILSGVQSVFAVWSTPQQVLNYTYDGIQHLDGLCAFDINDLNGADSVCIDILVCVKGKLCIYTYCVETRTLLNGMKSARGGAEDQSAGTTVTDGEPQLRPNPTTGEVEVVGTTDKVTEVLVLDMNGRKMAEYQQMSRFDVSDLPAGFYIVRLKTLSATDEKVSYVKLVKR